VKRKRGYPGALAKLRIRIAAQRKRVVQCTGMVRAIRWDVDVQTSRVNRIEADVKDIRKTLSDLVRRLTYGR
jgi:hypothetical protein